MSRARVRIHVLQQAHWWRAWFRNQPSAFADGSTAAHAVGQLVLDYPDASNLEVILMPLEPITFKPVQPGDWDKIRRGLARDGIVITEPQGVLERDGIQMRWAYDPAQQTLTVQCMKKPWLIPASAVQQKLKETFDRLMRT